FAPQFLKTMAQEKDEVLVDVQEVYSKTERYIEENKRSLAVIVIGIVVIIAGYFAWDKLYIGPKEIDAQKEMFMAEKYFEKDSIDKAINGDGNFKGFKYIIDEYGFTKAENLAHYYLGICYLKKGEYQNAIDQLNEFECDDQVVGPIAVGAIGDANMELGKAEEAISYYLKAAKLRENKFTTPIYLMKAGLAYEDQKNYTNAVKIYEQLKSDYAETAEGREVDKYLARAKALAGA
ncbi:MAG TPA: tetratricopeptide repeat protein, partial [Bacteroidia bacterium]|nr:tetratricopeptide repeat protein [Bacteroidia bacterium]